MASTCRGRPESPSWRDWARGYVESAFPEGVQPRSEQRGVDGGRMPGGIRPRSLRSWNTIAFTVAVGRPVRSEMTFVLTSMPASSGPLASVWSRRCGRTSRVVSSSLRGDPLEYPTFGTPVGPA